VKIEKRFRQETINPLSEKIASPFAEMDADQEEITPDHAEMDTDQEEITPDHAEMDAHQEEIVPDQEEMDTDRVDYESVLSIYDYLAVNRGFIPVKNHSC
jgi:hypothetical protein